MADAFAEQLGTLTVSHKSISVAREHGVQLTNQRSPDVVVEAFRAEAKGSFADGSHQLHVGSGHHRLALLYLIDAICSHPRNGQAAVNPQFQERMRNCFGAVLPYLAELLVTPINCDKAEDLFALWSRKGADILIRKEGIAECWKFIAAAKQAREQALAHRDIGNVVPRLGGRVAPLAVTDWYGTFGERPQRSAQGQPPVDTGVRLALKEVKPGPISWWHQQPGCFRTTCCDDPATAGTVWADAEELETRSHLSSHLQPSAHLPDPARLTNSGLASIDPYSTTDVQPLGQPPGIAAPSVVPGVKAAAAGALGGLVTVANAPHQEPPVAASEPPSPSFYATVPPQHSFFAKESDSDTYRPPLPEEPYEPEPPLPPDEPSDEDAPPPLPVDLDNDSPSTYMHAATAHADAAYTGAEAPMHALALQDGGAHAEAVHDSQYPSQSNHFSHPAAPGGSGGVAAVAPPDVHLVEAQEPSVHGTAYLQHSDQRTSVDRPFYQVQNHAADAGVPVTPSYVSPLQRPLSAHPLLQLDKSYPTEVVPPSGLQQGGTLHALPPFQAQMDAPPHAQLSYRHDAHSHMHVDNLPQQYPHAVQSHARGDSLPLQQRMPPQEQLPQQYPQHQSLDQQGAVANHSHAVLCEASDSGLHTFDSGGGIQGLHRQSMGQMPDHSGPGMVWGMSWQEQQQQQQFHHQLQHSVNQSSVDEAGVWGALTDVPWRHMQQPHQGQQPSPPPLQQQQQQQQQEPQQLMPWQQGAQYVYAYAEQQGDPGPHPLG